MVVVISTVISCASLGLQLIFNKLRDAAAKRLSERDVADQKIGKLISRELNDIKSKLEAQSRASLLSSIEFLKGGVVYLYHFFEQLESTSDDSHEERETEVASAASQRLERVSSGRMEELLSQLGDVGLDDLSPEVLSDLKECKERFKDSRRKATEAYSDESLSPSDRVLALKIRVIATILENIDRMSVSVAEECKLSVENLNSLSQVAKALKRVGGLGKVKNWFLNADEERSELVSNVAEVNFVVWKYECLCRGRTVPVHDLDTFAKRKLSHPISLCEEYSKILDLKNKERPVEERLIGAIDMAVTSEGNIVICDKDVNNQVKVFSRDGNFIFSFGARRPTDANMKPVKPLRIAIDNASGKMYALYVDYSAERSLIFVYSKLGEYLQTIKTINETLSRNYVYHIALNSHGNLLVCNSFRSVFIGVIELGGGEIIHKSFKLSGVSEDMTIWDMTTTDDGRVLMTCPEKNAIFVFSEDGQLINEIKVNCDDGPYAVVHNPHSKQIVVNTITRDGVGMLEIYTCDGSHVRSVKVTEELQFIFFCSLAVTPEGSIAVLNKTTGKLTYMFV